jgi:ABC-type uncharacterized transport system permease subunit
MGEAWWVVVAALIVVWLAGVILRVLRGVIHLALLAALGILAYKLFLDGQ